jgi:hypothetical protein
MAFWCTLVVLHGKALAFDKISASELKPVNPIHMVVVLEDLGSNIA